MRAVSHNTKEGRAFYIIRDVTKANGKRSTETLKDLGTEAEIKEKYKVKDAMEWAREQARIMNEEQPGRKVLVPYAPSERSREVHPSGPGGAVGDTKDGRHLLPEELDNRRTFAA